MFLTSRTIGVCLQEIELHGASLQLDDTKGVCLQLLLNDKSFMFFPPINNSNPKTHSNRAIIQELNDQETDPLLLIHPIIHLSTSLLNSRTQPSVSFKPISSSQQKPSPVSSLFREFNNSTIKKRRLHRPHQFSKSPFYPFDDHLASPFSSTSITTLALFFLCLLKMEGDNKRKTIIIQDSSEATKKQKQEIDRLDSEATKKQKQVVAVADLPPSLSPTYAYDVDAFPYLPGLSTAGFFSSSSGRAFRFLRPYPNLNLPLPSFFDIPSRFTILSSSSGLLLLRSASTYHVLNPFLRTPASHRQLPLPDRPHPPTTPAVLAVDTHNEDTDPVFHVICAIEEPFRGRHRQYSFDTFSSDVGGWSTSYDPNAMLLSHRRILPHTGVSNGRGMAFWLTDVPPAIVKLTIAVTDKVVLIEVPQIWINPWSNLQLGRLSETSIGLVAASVVNVVVLRLDLNEGWFRHGFLNVVRKENEAGEVHGELSVVCGERRERPEVMRFERDVPLWINRRMVVLEIDWEHRSVGTARLHEMPEWTRRPESVEDLVPYVCMELEAGNFPVVELEYVDFDDDD